MPPEATVDREMDAKRILHVILMTLVPFSSVLAQGAGESAKTETLVLKAQTVELEGLKAEIKAQGEKIDHLTQEMEALTEMLKQKSAPTVAKAEPAPTATPAPLPIQPLQIQQRLIPPQPPLGWRIPLQPMAEMRSTP